MGIKILLIIFYFSLIFCAKASGETPIQTMRNFFWMASGFPTIHSYQEFTNNDNNLQTLVPENGLSGLVTTLRTTILNGIYSELPNITKCEEIEQSGTVSISAHETLTFGVAGQTPPNSYPTATAYEKRIHYSNSETGVDAIFEFHCVGNGLFVKLTRTPDGGSIQNFALYYDLKDNQKYFDFYLDDSGNWGGNLYLAIILRVNLENNSFKLWVTRTGDTGGQDIIGYRFTVMANYTTQKNSLHFIDTSSTPMSSAQWDSDPLISSINVDGGLAPSSASPDHASQGCANDFDTLTSNIDDNTLCEGLPLEAAPQPPFGGNLSMEWVESQLRTELANIE